MNAELGPRIQSEKKEISEKEPFVDEAFSGIQARLLVGGRALNPEHKVLVVEPDKRTNKVSQTIKEIAKVSYSERREYWSTSHKDKSFAERMELWKNNFSSFLTSKTASLEGEKRDKWIRICKRFGFEDIEKRDISAEDVQEFYEKYFIKKGKKYVSNTDRFARDGLGVYIEDGKLCHRGEEDMQETKKMIEEIGKWSLGNVSGAVMGLLTDARAIYEDPNTKNILFEHANAKPTSRTARRVNRLTVYERELLEGFWYTMQKEKNIFIAEKRPLPPFPKKTKEETVFERFGWEPGPVKDDE